MWQVASSPSHRFRKNHVGRQIGAAATQVTQSAAGMGCINATCEQATGLHHLVAGVMHCSGRVKTAADHRHAVRDIGVPWQDLAQLDLG